MQNFITLFAQFDLVFGFVDVDHQVDIDKEGHQQNDGDDRRIEQAIFSGIVLFVKRQSYTPVRARSE